MALNRDFNALFRAPLERATEPKAWELTLVHFAKRLRVLGQRLEQIKDVHLRGQWRDNIPLFKLSSELQKISADKGLLSTLERWISKVKCSTNCAVRCASLRPAKPRA